jgi:hypothetical protein
VTSADCASGACVELRDDTSSSSIATTTGVDFTPYGSVTIGFTFLTRHLANGERFFVDVWNGSWVTVQGFTAGTNFANNVRYAASVPIAAAALLTSNARIRIRADGSNDQDLVFIDDVVVTGQP